MLIPIDRLITMPILSLQTGAELAQISDVIIDPRKLIVAAFRLKGPQLVDPLTVLHPEDIREMSDIGIIVDSSDQLMATEDLVRLQQIIDFGFVLTGVKVEDEMGSKLGTVKSYSLDPKSFYVQQLYIKPTFLKSVAVTHLTINRSQVISITNEKIIVKASTITEKASLEQSMKETLVNPFRTSAPTQKETKITP